MVENVKHQIYYEQNHEMYLEKHILNTNIFAKSFQRTSVIQIEPCKATILKLKFNQNLLFNFRYGPSYKRSAWYYNKCSKFFVYVCLQWLFHMKIAVIHSFIVTRYSVYIYIVTLKIFYKISIQNTWLYVCCISVIVFHGTNTLSL